MFLIRVLAGIVFVALGLAYLFDPRSVLRFNAFMRERVFRDSLVLLNNKRIGAALVAIGFVLLLISIRLNS